MRKVTVALYVVPILVAADLAAKFWARDALDGVVGPIPLIPGISLRLASNPGVSFGLFAGSPWPVTLVTAAMTAALALWFARAKADWEPLAIGCIMAGAASNLVDRLLNGAVTDFLSFGARDAPLFTNNLADIWITAGVIMLFGSTLLAQRRQSPVTRGERQ